MPATPHAVCMISSLSSKFINTKEVYELPLRVHDTKSLTSEGPTEFHCCFAAVSEYS